MFRKRTVRPIRANNAMFAGTGANTIQDRGAMQVLASYSRNPYFNNDYFTRWQEYTRWYNVSWEARKIIDIPIDDAFRVAPELKGLDDKTTKELLDKREELEVVKQLKRALKQERLYGGSVILPLFKMEQGADLKEPFENSQIKIDDLLGFNVIDVSKLSKATFENDPFSPTYDKIAKLTIQGVDVDVSRMLLFDGEPLTSRNSQTLLENFRYNPCGFGESKLTPLYDLLMRAIGTQQGAYHLVNMASVLLVEAENLRSLSATDNPVRDKLNEIVEQISIYRGAIIDAKGVKVTQHAASFGSVPELVITFTQLLSAASDIPATRFLGQAPDGFNATGESDTRNYYDMIDSFRQTKIRSAEKRIFDWIGCSLYGESAWLSKSKDFELVYPSLWSLPENEKAQADSAYTNMVMSLVNGGVITREQAVEDLNAKGIYQIELEVASTEDILEVETARANLNVETQSKLAKVQPEKTPLAKSEKTAKSKDTTKKD